MDSRDGSAPISFSNALNNFLNEKASSQKKLIELEEDEQFIRAINDLKDHWINEKMEIFFVVKIYFSGYLTVQDANQKTPKFQDFYEQSLKPLLKANFEKARTNACSELKLLIDNVEEFVFKCFDSCTTDGNYIKAVEQGKTLNDIADELKSKQDILDTLANETNKKFQDQSIKLSETSMSILGIFVGVVMVFFGGFSILENAIAGMANASPYRLAFTMVLFGAILFNILVLLFYLIGKLT